MPTAVAHGPYSAAEVQAAYTEVRKLLIAANLDPATLKGRIHLDYVFVYPVEPPSLPADWMRVVDRNYGNVDFATWDDPGGALEPWSPARESTPPMSNG
jgi:hypothetical protein